MNSFQKNYLPLYFRSWTNMRKKTWTLYLWWHYLSNNRFLWVWRERQQVDCVLTTGGVELIIYLLVVVRLLFFLIRWGWGWIGVDVQVTASQLEIQALSFSKKKLKGLVLISTRLDELDDVTLICKTVSGCLEESLLTVRPQAPAHLYHIRN